MFGGNFAPQGFALCDGQLLAISQNDALFSLLGTTYGGDGRTTFGLPDLRGRVPIHVGNGPGLTFRQLGSKSGSEQVTLTTANLPPHTHGFSASTATGDSKHPAQRLPAAGVEPAYADAANLVSMNTGALAAAGGSGGHTNLMPFQCVNFIIALVGIYPSRS